MSSKSPSNERKFKKQKSIDRRIRKQKRKLDLLSQSQVFATKIKPKIKVNIIQGSEKKLKPKKKIRGNYMGVKGQEAPYYTDECWGCGMQYKKNGGRGFFKTRASLHSHVNKVIDNSKPEKLVLQLCLVS